jgi:hypothetical protein
MNGPHLRLDAMVHYLERRHGRPVALVAVRELGGEASGEEALKRFGYGQPLRVTYRLDGEEVAEVFHTIRRTAFGRERNDDRVAAVWLDYQTFNALPRHVAAVDMIGRAAAGDLRSLGDLQELLLVTAFRPGYLYATDLARIRDEGKATAQDVARVEVLAGYLAAVHEVGYDAVPHPEDEAPAFDGRAALWRRRLRDLVGHGEGIMGLTDSYPLPLPYVTAEELRALEEGANRWRWRLKAQERRLCQVHGDFHPFNILFAGPTELYVLDRSRGPWGEAADDVSCLTINYLFFSLQRAGGLVDPFATLHRRFWAFYLAQRPDETMLAVIQPWFAWRALVLASPIWYPDLTPETRRRLLTFARRVLAAERYAWEDVNRYLEPGP